MDSEDDMHDANDVDSMDDYDGFYSDEDALDYYGSDDDDADVDFGDDNEGIQRIEASRAENNYIILKESDIKQRQEDDIASVSAVLSVSRVSSSILLRYFNWSVTKVHEAWFSDEDKVRKTVGLLKKPVVQFPNSRELTCGICFETFPRGSIRSAACGHPYCCACWKGYIRTSISDGPGCLTLRCPDPSCGASVGQDMISMLVSEEDNQKYSRYLIRSYIEDNKKTKWCPYPGCEHAVNFVGDNENYDVSCLCSYGFCWNCTEEAHRPVDCSTVEKWILKNSAESENMNWILANSKPCPKCKRPIEKNQGCMHMTCTPPCKFEFCWLCLGSWAEHGERTGGFYACNRYEAAKQEGAMEKLSDIQCEPESQLKFITDAWQQIVECRRVLKWTYAYGYYLPEREQAKRQFFEYLQGEAESALEKGLCDVDSQAACGGSTSSKNVGSGKAKGGKGKVTGRGGGCSRNV